MVIMIMLDARPRTAVLICKGPVERLPPVLSVLQDLAAGGAAVILVASSCSSECAVGLRARGVRIVEVGERQTLPKRSPVAKLYAAGKFRRTAWRIVSETAGPKLLWVASGETALVLGGNLRKYPYVLQLHELYDNAY